MTRDAPTETPSKYSGLVLVTVVQKGADFSFAPDFSFALKGALVN